MRKIWMCGGVMAALFLLLASGCGNPRRTVGFGGICADDPCGRDGLYNPGRGFRLETAVDVVNEKDNPVKELAELSDKYASDSVSLAQSYFYLTCLAGERLSEENFRTMQTYFDELRRQGKKAVLRFAYERDFMGRAAAGPTGERILEHLEQLKPFLEKNKDLILVVQAGMIGAWGEWHSSVRGLENSEEIKTAVLEKLLEVVPEERNVQVRLPGFKNLLKGKPELYKRISFHDDFIVIRPDRWDADMHEGTAQFEQIVEESPYLVVDGELPWGFWSVGADPDSPSTGWIIDGLQAARRLFLQHYTSLSVIHNYKEQHPNNRFDENNPPEYSMVVWKKTMITEDSLRRYRMPVSDNYFRKTDGTETERNVFDYIRDHLGYRIELQSLQLPVKLKKRGENRLDLNLVNRGFATVFGEHSVYFVLIDKEGRVTEFLTGTNPSDWQPFRPGDSACTPLVHSASCSLKLPDLLAAGKYGLGLWIPDGSDRLRYDPRYAVRCANGNAVWKVSGDGKYGINVLTAVEVAE
ncbi:DUF4874 domain-containing protein [uncultured Bacteroides sp.]|uniref:DUF4832 domain-containing protein n=1 Tax=uncultured Bacteroides sp. TaxID=162156 RepID=UPI002675A702|nr:DUF4874 domain-containing protein [uncultured Bacteroides sp.]